MTETSDAGLIADGAALRAFADLVIPGDGLFPPAVTVDAHGLLADVGAAG